jgi:hypothetical protein
MSVEPQLRTVGPTRAPSELSGRWRNRLGSIMELRIEDGGHRLSGSFRSGVGSPHPDRSYDLTGYAAGDAFVFGVDFAPHGSVGAWAGHHVSDSHGERLVTLWHLARPVAEPHSDTDLWGSMLAGSDEFQRVD